MMVICNSVDRGCADPLGTFRPNRCYHSVEHDSKEYPESCRMKCRRKPKARCVPVEELKKTKNGKGA
jgi:hypothetical protein